MYLTVSESRTFNLISDFSILNKITSICQKITRISTILVTIRINFEQWQKSKWSMWCERIQIIRTQSHITLQDRFFYSASFSADPSRYRSKLPLKIRKC